jgi:hypothetical protein
MPTQPDEGARAPEQWGQALEVGTLTPVTPPRV